jgi:hypothetical protein
LNLLLVIIYNKKGRAFGSLPKYKLKIFQESKVSEGFPQIQRRSSLNIGQLSAIKTTAAFGTPPALLKRIRFLTLAPINP